MVDVTRNLLLIKKNQRLLSAAEYFNYRLQKDTNTLFFVCTDTVVNRKFMSQQKNIADIYFNEDHFLRYYIITDLSKVYTARSKIKRYFLADPWFEMYDPGKRHSNFLFRVKQFFLFGMMTLILWTFFYQFKK